MMVMLFEVVKPKSPKALNIVEVYKATPRERMTNAILREWMKTEELPFTNGERSEN